MADPINQYPSIFGDSVFLKQHPFFLIMLASSLVSFIGLVAGSLWLKESKNFNRNIENDPLLASDSRDTIEQTESNDSTTDSTGGIRGSLFPILTAAMLNLIYNTYFEVYSIFLASSKETSGLGFSASNISIVFFISGIIGIIVQLLYVYLERLLGGAYLGLQLGMLLHIPTLGTTGLIYYLKDTTIQIIVLSIYSIMRSICGSIAFTSSMLLLNNSAQSNLARINGVSQTITCLTRSIGPAMGGLIWSWSLRNEYPFDFQFVFYLTGLCSFFGFWLARLVPREYDSVVKKEEEDVDIY